VFRREVYLEIQQERQNVASGARDPRPEVERELGRLGGETR
jgi:hypothetical protein